MENCRPHHKPHVNIGVIKSDKENITIKEMNEDKAKVEQIILKALEGFNEKYPDFKTSIETDYSSVNFYDRQPIESVTVKLRLESK